MKAEINVVPYIDVMLVLLIIFMVTSPFVTQGVDVELPKTHSAKSAQDLAGDSDSSFIIVEIDKEGNLGLSVNDEEVQRGLSIEDVIVRVKAELSLKLIHLWPWVAMPLHLTQRLFWYWMSWVKLVFLK